jgi:lysophospholipase L1-like esterase
VIWKLLNDTSILFNNMATYGLTITNLQAQFATDVTWQYDPSIPNVVVFMAGTNDLGGGASAATAYNSMKTYCNAVAAVGITKMVVGTLMDRSSNFTNGVTASSFNVARATYNNLLKTQLMTDCPVVKQIADVAADSRLGANGASIPTTYFVDGTHPNDAGYAIMASIFATAIRAA